MSRLSYVTEEMAVKLLSEVEFSKRLEGTSYHAMSGGKPVLMTYLEEVKEFLRMGSPKSLLTLGGGGSVNYLNGTELKTWIEEVFGDFELANAIGEEIDQGKCYADTIEPIKSLLEERLQQCKALLLSNQNEQVPS